MFQIVMDETRRGTNDGFSVMQFHRGIIYTVGDTIGDTLARRFINAGWAHEVSTAKDLVGWGI